MNYDDDEKLTPMVQMIKTVVFDILSWEAEEQRRDILETQRQGIESARKSGKHLGRPPKMINYTNFKKEYDLWKSGKQTANLTMKKLNWSKTSFMGWLKNMKMKF